MRFPRISATVRGRLAWAALAFAVVALQAAMAAWLVGSGDELNVVGIAREYAKTRRVIRQTPGLPIISHTPAGGLVQAVFSLGGTVQPTLRTGRILSFVLAVAGVLVVTLALVRCAPPGYAFWFLAVYGLSPWTVYHSARAFEPGLMFIVTSVAFAAAIRLKSAARFWPSVALGWAAVSACQAYASFAIPLLGYGMLLWRRRLRVAIAGAAMGGVAGSVTLWPMLFPRPLDPVSNAVTTRSHLGARFGYGVRHGYPIVRAAGFWFRMASSDLNRQVRENRLFTARGARPTTASFLVRGVMMALMALAFVSVACSVWANVWFFGRGHRDHDPEMGWLREYAGAMLVSLLIASAIAPVCIQGYHATAALPGACVPAAAWFRHIWDGGTRQGRALILGLLALEVAVTLAVAVGYGR
jgi:hypothetical protein